MKSYHDTCFPKILKEPTGKAKKCGFEKIDNSLYEHDARMVAFRVTRERIRPWLGALSLYYYEHLGRDTQYNIQWKDDPMRINTNNKELLNTIAIDINKNKPQTDNPLSYKVKVFATTGTIQAQGNKHDTFRTRDFPILLEGIETICNNPDLLPSDNQEHFTDSESEDLDATVVKQVEEMNNNKSPHICNTQAIDNKYENTTSDQTEGKIRKSMEVNIESNLVNAIDKIHKQNSDSIETYIEKLEETITKLCKNQEGSLKSTLQGIEKGIYDKLSSLSSYQNRVETTGSNSQIVMLKRKNNELESEIMELKKSLSNSNFELVITESKLKAEEKAHEHTRKKLESITKDIENERESLHYRLRSKESEITQYEEEMQRYRQLMHKKEDEILALKSHFSSLMDTRNFTEVNNTKSHISSNEVNYVNKTTEDPTTRITPLSGTKPMLLLVGTSNLSKIDTDKWNTSYITTKRSAYTMEEAGAIIEEVGFKPNAVILHVLTNDVKNFTPVECASRLELIVTKVKAKFSDAKVVVSLTTPRTDKVEWNDNCDIVCILVKQKLRDIENLIISDNSNLSFKGAPKAKFLNSDGYHLSDDGAAILGANMKSAVDKILGTKTTRGKPINWNPRERNKSSRGCFRDRRPYQQAYYSYHRY